MKVYIFQYQQKGYFLNKSGKIMVHTDSFDRANALATEQCNHLFKKPINFKLARVIIPQQSNPLS